MDIDKYIRPNIRDLAPYSTARDEYQGEIGIYLDANENPYDNGLNRYPDPYQKALKARLSRLKGVPPENIFVGNGSDEPIDLAYRVFCEPGREEAVAAVPTYGMYKVAAAVNDVRFTEVPLDGDFRLDARRVLEAVTPRTKLVFLCSPNNPSGNLLDEAQVEKVVRGFDGIVVLDEAYVDFAGKPGFLPRLKEFPNLVVFQTLSKAWGMAGLRLGLAFADRRIVETMTRVKYPYNINVLTQRTVLERLDREEENVRAQTAVLAGERERLFKALQGFPFIRKVYPSDANFLLVKADRARELYERLIGGGIIVRDRSKVGGCADCLRITVGTPAQNDRLLELLSAVKY